MTSLALPGHKRHRPRQQVCLRIEPELTVDFPKNARGEQYLFPIPNGWQRGHRPRRVVQQPHHWERPLRSGCRLRTQRPEPLAGVADHCLTVRDRIRDRLGRIVFFPTDPEPVWALDAESHRPRPAERAGRGAVPRLPHGFRDLDGLGRPERRGEGDCRFHRGGRDGEAAQPGQGDDSGKKERLGKKQTIGHILFYRLHPGGASAPHQTSPTLGRLCLRGPCRWCARCGR